MAWRYGVTGCKQKALFRFDSPFLSLQKLVIQPTDTFNEPVWPSVKASGGKQKGLGSIPLWLSFPFSSKTSDSDQRYCSMSGSAYEHF